MNGQDVGYIRVSAVDQTPDRQLAGITLDRAFTDKASARDVQRPALVQCLNYLRQGDVLHVHSIDRLARNLADLQNLVHDLVGRGVVVRFHKEGLTFSDAGDPMQRLMFQLIGAVSEFERALIRERQREGIAAAKALGRRLGRRSSLTREQVAALKRRVAQGESKVALAREFGVSRQSVYHYLKRDAS